MASTAPTLRQAALQGAPWAWAGLGASVGLILAWLLFAPAHWLTGAVERVTDGRVQLTEARGTVWTGSARLVLTGGSGSQDAAALPGRMAWTLRPNLRGLQLTLLSDCCTALPLKVQVTPQWRGARLTVADGRSQWPAGLLVGLGTPWNTLQLDGQLGLQTQGVSVEWNEGRLAVAGRTVLEAQQISSRLSTLRPMGSYRITVNGGLSSTLQLDTLDGSLQLTGSGEWVGSRLRFRGTASAAPEREGALSNLLNIIGRRSGARSIISIG